MGDARRILPFGGGEEVSENGHFWGRSTVSVWGAWGREEEDGYAHLRIAVHTYVLPRVYGIVAWEGERKKEITLKGKRGKK